MLTASNTWFLRPTESGYLPDGILIGTAGSAVLTGVPSTQSKLTSIYSSACDEVGQ